MQMTVETGASRGSKGLPMLFPPDKGMSGHVVPAVSLVLTLVLASLIGAWLTGEIIPVNDGFGWDGYRYGELVRAFGADLLTLYYMQRIAPSALLHVIMHGIGAPLDNASITLGFQFLSLILILMALAAWLRIARRMKLGPTGLWIGAIGLFVNFAVLKIGFFYSVLTDLSAFTLGLIAFALFLEGKKGWLLFTAAVASFTWPGLGLCCAFLLLHPFQPGPDPDQDAAARGYIGIAGAAAIALGLAGRFAYLYLRGTQSVGYGPVSPIDENWAWVSAAAAAAFAFLAFATLFGRISFTHIIAAVRGIRWPNLVRAVLALLLPAAIAMAIAAIMAPAGRAGLSVEKFVDFVAFLPAVRPLVSLAAHFAYFGPVVILLVVYWPRIASFIRSAGPGLVLFAAFNLFVALGPETRQSMPGVAVFIAILAIVADRDRWRPWAIGLFAVASLVGTKLWLPLNQWTPAGAELLADRYFNNIGPYMTADAYLIYLALFGLSGMALWLCARLGARTRVGSD